MDYDLTLHVNGAPGLDYSGLVHEYPALCAPDWVLPYYRILNGGSRLSSQWSAMSCSVVRWDGSVVLITVSK